MYKVQNGQPNFVPAPQYNAPTVQQLQASPVDSFQNSAIPAEGVRPVIKRHGLLCKIQGWFGSQSPEHHHRVQREKDSLAKYEVEHAERERRIALMNERFASGASQDAAAPVLNSTEATEKDFSAALSELNDMKRTMEFKLRQAQVRTRNLMKKGGAASHREVELSCRRLAKQELFIKQTADWINNVEDMKNTVQISHSAQKCLGVVNRVVESAQVDAGDPNKTVEAFLKQKQNIEAAFAAMTEAVEIGVDPNGILDAEGAATEQRMADEIFRELQRQTGYVAPAVAQPPMVPQAAVAGQSAT